MLGFSLNIQDIGQIALENVKNK
ncbi:hypothetical protein [Carnobacterium mobile]